MGRGWSWPGWREQWRKTTSPCLPGTIISLWSVTASSKTVLHNITSVDHISYPVPELGDSGVNPGPVPAHICQIFLYARKYFLFRPVPAADAPADDAGQAPPPVLALDDQRAAAVALAAVLAAGLRTRAHEDVRDPLVLAGVPKNIRC